MQTPEHHKSVEFNVKVTVVVSKEKVAPWAPFKKKECEAVNLQGVVLSDGRSIQRAATHAQMGGPPYRWREWRESTRADNIS